MMEWMLHTASWPARAICGAWTDEQIVWHRACGLTIGLCYYLIPLLLAVLFRRTVHAWLALTRALESGRGVERAAHRLTQQKVRNPALLLLLSGLFIASCGTAHLTGDVLMFSKPMYNLHGTMLSITAIASISMVLALLAEIWCRD